MSKNSNESSSKRLSDCKMCAVFTKNTDPFYVDRAMLREASSHLYHALESPKSRLVLLDDSEQAVRAIVKFLSTGKISMENDELTIEVAKAALRCRIPRLIKVIVDHATTKPELWGRLSHLFRTVESVVPNLS